MKDEPQPGAVLIGCAVLQAELAELHRRHWPQLTLRLLESTLHTKPDALAGQLLPLVEEELGRGRRVVVIYGDCAPALAALEGRTGVVRTRGNNCYGLLLGREEYRGLSREGAFFLLPEWTRRWREIFEEKLGLSPDTARVMMREMHQKLVYLDTGVDAVPAHDLQECAHYLGLPCEIRPVGLDLLRDAIRDALHRLESEVNPE